MTGIELALAGAAAFAAYKLFGHKESATLIGPATAAVTGKSGNSWVTTLQSVQGAAKNTTRTTVFAKPGSLGHAVSAGIVPILDFLQVGGDPKTRALVAVHDTTKGPLFQAAMSDFGVKAA